MLLLVPTSVHRLQVSGISLEIFNDFKVFLDKFLRLSVGKSNIKLLESPGAHRRF